MRLTKVVLPGAEEAGEDSNGYFAWRVHEHPPIDLIDIRYLLEIWQLYTAPLWLSTNKTVGNGSELWGELVERRGIPLAAPWATTVVYYGFTGVAAKSVGIFLGALTILVASFSKLLAILIAIPSPVVSAVYIIIFGMLFVEGAKTVFTGQVDQKKASITGVSMVLGLSAGVLSGFFDGVTSHVVGNAIVVGGMAAIVMTVFTELSGFRARKLRVDLSPVFPASRRRLSLPVRRRTQLDGRREKPAPSGRGRGNAEPVQ